MTRTLFSLAAAALLALSAAPLTAQDEPEGDGDVLTATASERWQSGRNGLYDVEVQNQRGERVALLRGRSYRLKDKPVVHLG